MVLSEKAAARTSWGLTLLTVLVMVYAVGNMHTVKRDRDLLHDINLGGRETAGQEVTLHADRIYDYELIAYLAHYYNSSIDNTEADHAYRLVRTHEQIECTDHWKGRGALSYVSLSNV